MIEVNEANRLRGSEVREGCVLRKTRDEYNRKVLQFRLWLVDNYPDVVDESGEILLDSLNQIIWDAFWGHCQLKKNKEGDYLVPHQLYSYEHVSGYKSAIIKHYHDRGKRLPENVELSFKAFFAGLKRKIGENNSTTMMAATGVPPHLVLLGELGAMKEEVRSSQQAIAELKEELPVLLKKKLLENFTVKGVVPITSAEIFGAMETMKADLTTAIQESGTRLLAAATTAVAGAEHVPVVAPTQFHWGGRLHPVPEGFSFPSTATTADIWRLWWNGDGTYGAYRHLKGFDCTKRSRPYLSSATSLMNRFVQESDHSATEIAAMTIPQKHALFSKLYKALCVVAYGVTSEAEGKLLRHPRSEHSYLTFRDRLRKA